MRKRLLPPLAKQMTSGVVLAATIVFTAVVGAAPAHADPQERPPKLARR